MTAMVGRFLFLEVEKSGIWNGSAAKSRRVRAPELAAHSRGNKRSPQRYSTMYQVFERFLSSITYDAWLHTARGLSKNPD
jgi:hypothetical protein